MLERVTYVAGEDEPYPGPPESQGDFADLLEAIKSFRAAIHATAGVFTKWSDHFRPTVPDDPMVISHPLRLGLPSNHAVWPARAIDINVSAPVAYLSPTSGHWEHFHMDPAFGGMAPLISWTDEYVKPLSDKEDTSIIDRDSHGKKRQPHGPYEGVNYGHKHQKRY